MEKTALRWKKPGSRFAPPAPRSRGPIETLSAPPEKSASVATSDLHALRDGWLLDCRGRSHSPSTIEFRQIVLSKLTWFLETRACPDCGPLEIRQFLVYLRVGHEDKGGRFGNPQLTQPPSARTVKDYYATLRTFFRWLLAEGLLPVSPVDTIGVPIARQDEIVPFTKEQVDALLKAARAGTHPRRDVAILLFLLDTGVRASELCGLRVRHLERIRKSCTVLGKGNKHRPVYFGSDTSRALWVYLQESPRRDESALFVSDRGLKAGRALTRSGLYQVIQKLGVAAGVEAHPHTFRHTFAYNFLLSGGKGEVLQRLLGHTKYDMTLRYVNFARANVEHQYQEHSPVQWMNR